MKFSIVTISYNQARFLEEAILSVLNQDGVDVEYIVVDPGSTDGSREIIERYRDRIARVIFEPDHGPADGLNKGFALATGDVYGYLNSDDVLLPGALDRARCWLTHRSDVDVVSAHAYVIDEKDKVVQRVFSHKFDVESYAAGCCVLIQQSTFFRAEWFKKVGGFMIGNAVAWDGELAVDMALAGAHFTVVPEFWSQFRVYPASISGSRGYAEKLRREHSRLRDKKGIADCSPWRRRYLRLTNWMRQPLTLGMRLWDGLVYPDRVL